MSIAPCRKPWKSGMTGRQRFNNHMHYKPVDRCFNMEFGYWSENFQLWPMFKDNHITNNDQANAYFNFDKIIELGVWWEDNFSTRFFNPPFENKVLEETATTKTVMNDEGLIATINKVEAGSAFPQFHKASIVTPDDWKRCKEERLRRDDPVRKLDIEAIKKAHPSTRDYPIGIWCGSMIGKVRDILTFEGLAYAAYDYPDMVEDMVETCCVLVEDILDQTLGKIDFDYASGWEDICFKNGPIVTMDFFKNVVVPRYKRIHKKLAAHGIDIWYTDCDGDVRPLIPLMLESGINCLFPWEVNGSGHPGETLKKYDGQLRIMGGFDKMKLGQGQKAIKEYMQTLVPLVEHGGFIPFCDHRCPPNVKQEDYLYYLDLKEKMFGMK